jgi:uncharacterized repeat protein (TIGR01451 family)
MKKAFLLLAVLFLSITAKSQCEPPQILGWAVNTEYEWTYNISFFAPADGLYIFRSESNYGPVGDGGAVTIELQEITAGVNDITLSLNPFYYSDSITFYLECTMERTCGDEDSSIVEFYLSDHSLVGDGSYDFENLNMPFEQFSEQPDNVVETILNYPNEDEFVESIELFVDIGHDNWSDLSIELEHPSGLIIQLLEFTPEEDEEADDNLDFSLLFSDLGLEVPEEPNEFMGPRGRFLPAEPLSTFDGLTTQGDWILRITDNVDDENDGLVFGVGMSLTCSPNYRGHAYYDSNSNGTLDDGEVAFPYPYVLNTIDDNELFGAVNGDFADCGESGTGILSILNVPNYFTTEPAPIDLNPEDQFEEYLVSITATELISDIAVDLISLEPNRPGFEANYLAQISQVGTICEDDITANITFPDYVEIVSSPNPDLVIAGNTATIAVDQVCPFGPFDFILTILLDDTVSLGTMLEATISANVSDEDPNALNNIFTSVVELVGSYDPNDKQVSATTIGDEFLEDGAPLKYTIRFQNTGTFYAERVVIADTIDADLDINSIQIISTSHNMQLAREGNVLYFEFDQIFLPDSTTDFDGSIGNVRYEITPFPTFSEGETIENTAYIYFDFNEPIVTNTVVTEFGNPLSVSNEIAFETRIFPNPANENISVSWAQDVRVDRIEVYDLTGRLIKGESISADKIFTMDISDLTNGMYLINLVSGDQQSRQKFMKLGER